MVPGQEAKMSTGRAVVGVTRLRAEVVDPGVWQGERRRYHRIGRGWQKMTRWRNRANATKAGVERG